jgi:hypothetical protein
MEDPAMTPPNAKARELAEKYFPLPYFGQKGTRDIDEIIKLKNELALEISALMQPAQGMSEDDLEAAYWNFDARKSGYVEWKTCPQSERDAFKQVARLLLKGYQFVLPTPPETRTTLVWSLKENGE